MKEEAKRLHKDLMDNPALEQKLNAILEKGSPEEQARSIQELGYQLGPEDLSAPDLETVEDDELEAVSGGSLCWFLGETRCAVDGHEIGCKTHWWYADDKEVENRICPKGSEATGWYHDWDKKPINAYYDLWTCKRCGKSDTQSVGW